MSLTSLCPFCSFCEDGMDMMERLVHLFRKFHQLKISNEEYVCMKAINFLNQGKNANTFTLFFHFFSQKLCYLLNIIMNVNPLRTRLKMY